MIKAPIRQHRVPPWEVAVYAAAVAAATLGSYIWPMGFAS